VKRYAEVLRMPHVLTLVASTWLARFPIGINALALILNLREQTGSDGEAEHGHETGRPRGGFVPSSGRSVP
jgi:hypothetical protein